MEPTWVRTFSTLLHIILRWNWLPPHSNLVYPPMELSSFMQSIHNWTFTMGIQSPQKTWFFLMDSIMQANIPEDQKIFFNEIRLHLRVVTAADIVQLGTTSTILPQIIKGKRARPSTWHWPSTKPFPRSWLKIWNSLLQTYIVPKLQHNPLGAWISNTHQIW